MSFSTSRLGRGFLLSLCLGFAAAGTARAVGSAEGDVIGEIVSVFRDVKVLEKGRGNTWTPVKKGYKVRLLDVIRTGPKGRARIEFADRLQEDNAGPSVVNIGSSSEVAMESYAVRFQRPKKVEGILNLISGSVRAFIKNWGPESAFSVRTGTSLCGIRGSEEVITFFGGDAPTYQTCLSGNCFTMGDGQARNLDSGYQRHIPSPNPDTWRDFKLTQEQLKRLIERTEMPGNDGKTEENKFEESFGGSGGGTGGGAPSETFMGVRWTPDGVPDCRAEVAELVLNSYKWDDIKDYRDFTFYKDELINDRFVVSGMIQTNCLAELLNVQVSVDGGISWAEARFSEETGTFRYAFDPTGFRDLDLRVRPTFRPEYIEKYRQKMGLE